MCAGFREFDFTRGKIKMFLTVLVLEKNVQKHTKAYYMFRVQWGKRYNQIYVG